MEIEVVVLVQGLKLERHGRWHLLPLVFYRAGACVGQFDVRISNFPHRD